MHSPAIEQLRQRVTDRLLAELGPDGFWSGRLSDSALATAVASFALARAGNADDARLAARGHAWLVAHANADGGWGDTPESCSNLSTTLLVWAALGTAAAYADTLASAEAWLTNRIGSLSPEAIVTAVLKHYGADRTFSVPILTMLALAGKLGPSRRAWASIPQLPFELALLPASLLHAARLPVVSYALPALIAMGQARLICGVRSRSPLAWLRRRLTPAALGRLERIQPANGGFLEASPLTGFVAMSLHAAGHGTHPVVGRCLDFLRGSARECGAWPIDTHLATWLTSLSTRALIDSLTRRNRARIRAYLLAAQHRTRHPYTGAAPGGWGWTHLPGGVPDGDDTAAALIALRRLGAPDKATTDAVRDGLLWLIGLQNRDGGIPTFCRGWGRLPFDRSCPDLTAHALTAWAEWHADAPPALRTKLARAMNRAKTHLAGTQSPDGSWTPLWFGNQNQPDHANPVYGTSQVLRALNQLYCLGFEPDKDSRERARDWLVAAQHPSGGWGGAPGIDPSVEETALALAALRDLEAGGPVGLARMRGLMWLNDTTEGGSRFPAAPIGLYFASLWYAETLYPLVFTAEALHPICKE